MTRAEAAQRVGRTERTIRNWERSGELTPTLGRFRESDLVEADRRMRARVGRPRKTKYTNQPNRTQEEK